MFCIISFREFSHKFNYAKPRTMENFIFTASKFSVKQCSKLIGSLKLKYLSWNICGLVNFDWIQAFWKKVTSTAGGKEAY